MSVAASFGIASSNSGPSAQATDYLNNALSIIRQNSVDSADIDWSSVYDHSIDVSRGARSTSDTYPAIVYAVDALDDWHSRFIPPQQVSDTTAPSGTSVPTGRQVGTDLAYVAVPSVGDGSDEVHNYTAQGVQLMSTLAATHPCGWIVDLRGNGGGDMWPMVTTIMPLLGASTVGYFVSSDGQRTPWRLMGGRAYYGTDGLSVMPNTLVISPSDVPIAVLVDNGTASSGEAVLIAFIGQRGVRTFGQPTAGVPSANEGFRLPDGAVLLLTAASDADRTGHVYPHLNEAESWLRSTSGCSTR